MNNTFSTIFLRSLWLMPLTSSGKATLSSWVRWGNRPIFWKTMPIFFAIIRRKILFGFFHHVFSINQIFPDVGCSSRLTYRAKVDLPLPDNPMMQKISPSRTEKLIFWTPTTQPNLASTSFFDKFFHWIACIASIAWSPNFSQTSMNSMAKSDVNSFLEATIAEWFIYGFGLDSRQFYRTLNGVEFPPMWECYSCVAFRWKASLDWLQK